jgi:hypothetical protein
VKIFAAKEYVGSETTVELSSYVQLPVNTNGTKVSIGAELLA